MSQPDPATATADPKGLIREAFLIKGITLDECRSILIDWALSLPLGLDTGAAIDLLLAHYGAGQNGHPMLQLLTEARSPAGAPKRRGGRAGRV